ncbi:hypothetical protein J1N35_017843 [Gossypium stocksii]|uniref:Uncharacterized protein n=1 Tax=Gossypium stocksii TaxID=47602 RepID=A0A9D3VMV7_9ROSI|nr:hypothetical protein J1N35_017843 [Gossypium stocksii]
MTTMNSADSALVEDGCTIFTGDRVVNSFPRHEVVKLDKGTFIQWQQQVLLILGGYDLIGFLDGTLPSSSRFIQSPDGSLASNPTACDMWTTVMSLFATNTGAKQSRIRHELHSLKKGTLSIKNYIAHIRNLCAFLEASGTRIQEAEKTEVMLIGLPANFNTVVSSVSVLSKPVSF